ncbi:MAG: hypothetical protein ACO1OC_10300 [Tuberibacillus sp.]
MKALIGPLYPLPQRAYKWANLYKNKYRSRISQHTAIPQLYNPHKTRTFFLWNFVLIIQKGMTSQGIVINKAEMFIAMNTGMANRKEKNVTPRGTMRKAGERTQNNNDSHLYNAKNASILFGIRNKNNKRIQTAGLFANPSAPFISINKRMKCVA